MKGRNLHLQGRFENEDRKSGARSLYLQCRKSDREIAESLFIGTRTVETHVSNLIAKLGVHNRTEATARAMQTGLVDGPR